MVHLSNVYERYMQKPTAFVFSFVSFLAYAGITFFALLFIYMNAQSGLNALGLADYSLVFMGLLLLIWFILTSGFKGSMLKGFKLTLDKGIRYDTEEFVSYAFSNSLKFFVVYFIQLLVNAALFAPLIYLLITGEKSTVILAGVGLISLFFSFIFNYMLFFAALALVNYPGIGSIRAIFASIRVSLTNIFSLMPAYILYIIVVITIIIPLVNLISLFLLYPIITTYAIAKLGDADKSMARYL